MINWDNSNRLYKIYYRFRPYTFFILKRIQKGVSIFSIIRTQFPFILPDASIPPSIALEFSGFCDIKCKYCNNHYKKREKGFLNESILNKIINDFGGHKVELVAVGGGEPTLNPSFEALSFKLAKVTKYLCITTNGQWPDTKIADILLNCSYSQIDISLDSGGKEMYEYSREKASYDRVISNINYLIKKKKELKSKTLIVIRLMIRPSQSNSFKSEIKYWRKKVDLVLPQYIIKTDISDYSEDVYIPINFINNSTRRCTIPFKNLSIRWNGDIPVCSYADNRYPEQLIIGNINNDNIFNIWNSQSFINLRNAHRKRSYNNIFFCNQCFGV
ncbi:MAG: radical SAM protein [Bacteroidetes bacterium]|nr:radical SAM protein [Bacteroidota bacterium]